AVRKLGEFLKVERCGYAELDQLKDEFVIKAEYTSGTASSIIGQYTMSDFGQNEQHILKDHCLYVVNDIEAEAPPGTDLALYRRGQIRSLVCVPLMKEGSFAARMAVHQGTPRRWTCEEISLIRAVANRCRESVERAKAVRTLRVSEERFAKAFQASP